ncbi:MAG: hypothetical protein ACC655_06010 [Rhodothermia bacterium]
MGNWIAGLVGVVVTGVIMYIIATLTIQSQERSVSAVQQRAVRTSEMNLVGMVESDFQNIGSNFPAFVNDPEFAITAYDTTSATKVFQFTGQTVRWAPPDTVRYEWNVLGSKKIKKLDGTLKNADVYQIKRFVNGTLSGSSTGAITRFQIRLRKSDGSPIVGASETRQVLVGISMVSSLGSSTLLGETHWDTIIRPAAMARWDYMDYIEI